MATIERVALRAALDRVLAEDVMSPINVPAHDNAAMDGYAFDGAVLNEGAPSADGSGTTQLTLDVAGKALAGHPFIGTLAPRQCVRIMTGAPMPAGSDTVVLQESVTLGGGQITFDAQHLARGAHCRLAGEDLARGRPALHAGRIMRPSDIGLVASLGIGEVAVRRRLRVAFFSTGDELRSVGEPLEAGCVYDSNRYTLSAMLARLNVEALDLGVVRDEPAAFEAAFRSAAQSADVVLSSGGVSVGEADFTRRMFETLGDVAFWRLAIRPGRPLAFGRLWPNGESGRNSQERPALFLGCPAIRGRDGDVLSDRAGSADHNVRCARTCAAAINGGRHRSDQETRGPHRIPARHRHTRSRWRVACRANALPRRRRPKLDERSELLHRACTRAR